MGPTPTTRAVHLEALALSAYNRAAESDIPGFVEGYKGLEWFLRQTPHRGKRRSIGDPPRYEYARRPKPTAEDVPFLWAYYTFDDTTVNILGLRVAWRNIVIS